MFVQKSLFSEGKQPGGTRLQEADDEGGCSHAPGGCAASASAGQRRRAAGLPRAGHTWAGGCPGPLYMAPLSRSTMTTSSNAPERSVGMNRLGACRPIRNGIGAAR